MRLSCLAALLIGALASASHAHEFWIDPQSYQVTSGSPLIADIRNGQKFKGLDLSYLERNFVRFDLVGPVGNSVDAKPVPLPVTGRTGDVPALRTVAGAPGLWVIVHQTTPSTLTYQKWEKFQAFADHKDFADIQNRHKARGLPDAGFKESYTRFAKSLIAVDDGAGQDRAVGLETEFVALQNPYTESTDTLPFLLLYQGKPRPHAQVEMFDRAPDDQVTVTLHRTDADGRVTLPVTPGHRYLLDAVVLRDMPSGADAAWETLWAALTFAVP